MTLPVLTRGTEYETGTISVTVAASGTVSSVATLRGWRIGGIEMPAAFTGTSIQFDVSSDGETFQRLYDPEDDSVIALTVAAGRSYPVNLQHLWAWPYVKLVVASQAAARTIKLVVRPL